MSGADRFWYGDDAIAGATRVALSPFSAVFGVVTAARTALYDNGVFATTAPAIPCVSVGNLTVGGTGKTPFAAWLAGRFREGSPAIVLRGYGSDEALVHRKLNPGVPVVENPDRLAAVRDAVKQGARLAILDDAFQHRRIARMADIVLVSVEQLLRPYRMLLPAGPWREPLAAAQRAGLMVLTRKSASAKDAELAREMLRAAVPNIPIAMVHLAPHQLERADGKESRPLETLKGATVRSIVGIGEPGAFQRQLEQLGANVQMTALRDHHAFTAAEAESFANSTPADALVVCTLKDVVKLSPLWPPSRGLWYVSQHLVVEQGAEYLDRLCASVLERASSAAAG
jgi:tetraacyldisaccharide 4'-kinase